MGTAGMGMRADVMISVVVDCAVDVVEVVVGSVEDVEGTVDTSDNLDDFIMGAADKVDVAAVATAVAGVEFGLDSETGVGELWKNVSRRYIHED